MGKVLMGMSLAIMYMAGNIFLWLLAQDEIVFTSWGAIGMINLWLIAVVFIALATRRMCQDD